MCDSTLIVPPIRDSAATDAEQMYQLRSDSRLTGMQYPAPSLEYIRATIDYATPGVEIPSLGLKISSIILDQKFIGHITEQYATDRNGQVRVLLGWNLQPEFWGRGLMVRALSRLFQQRWEARRELVFLACCFSTNRRCLRVIEKLGFQAVKLTIGERLAHFSQTWGRQKVLKHRLTYDQFLWSHSLKSE